MNDNIEPEKGSSPHNHILFVFICFLFLVVRRRGQTVLSSEFSVLEASAYNLRLLPIRRIFHANFNDAGNIATAIQHPLNADPLFIRQIVNQKIRSADDPKSQGSVPGSPPGMRTRQRMLGKEPCGFLRQFEKSLGRLWALSDGNIGENAIKVALRPGADSGFHLPFSELLSEFLASLADSLPNRIGQREMFAVYSFVDQGIKFVGIRRFVGPQNK